MIALRSYFHSLNHITSQVSRLQLSKSWHVYGMHEAFPALMEADFETLLVGILWTKKPACTGSSAPEKKCALEGIETDEEFVRQKCGLVLGQVYSPDEHWLEHAVKEKEIEVLHG